MPSLGSNLLRPVEFGSIYLHAMQNDRELTCDCNLCLAEPVALGVSDSPGLHGGPFWDARQQNPGCFPQGTSQHGITAFRDFGPIDPPPRRRGVYWSARHKHRRFSTAQTVQDRQSLL